MRTLIDGPRPIVALHGFTLHGGQFTRLAQLLGRPFVAPDLPGHGATTFFPTRFADAIEAVAGFIGGHRPPLPLIGYSQGGRIALGVALDHPDLVSHLVVISTATGIDDDADRMARREADAALADRIEADGTGAFIERWLERPEVAVTGVDPAVRAEDRAMRLENRPDGLAAALRGMGQGAQPPLGGRLGELAVPLLVIAGGNDLRYVAASRRLAGAVAGARLVIVPDRGHNVVLEDPAAVGAAIDDFLPRPPA